MNRRNLLTTLLSTATVLLAAASCAAAPLPGNPPLRDRVAGYELTVLIDGVPARTYQHGGETYVLGQLGARYTLRVSNHSGRRIEAVASVDGRDAIDGRPGDFRSKRGYLVPAWGSVDIDGWRVSQSEAAAFRFSSVPDSYAARTGGGREVGVIGVAVFPERYVPPVVMPRPYAAPRADGSPFDARDREAPAASAGAGAPAQASPPPSARAESAEPARRSRPGLGTEYGEAVSSPIYEVEFVRANAARPAAVLGLRYDDREGLLAMGIPLDDGPCASDADLRLSADPFPVVDRRYAAPPVGWRRAACGWR